MASPYRGFANSHRHITLGRTPLNEGPIPDNTQHSQETCPPSARFEPAIPARKRKQIIPRGHWDQQSVTCHLLVSQSFRQQFEKNRLNISTYAWETPQKILYIGCKLFRVHTCPIMVHSGQKQGWISQTN